MQQKSSCSICLIRHISIIYHTEGAVSFRVIESMENCSWHFWNRIELQELPGIHLSKVSCRVTPKLAQRRPLWANDVLHFCLPAENVPRDVNTQKPTKSIRLILKIREWHLYSYGCMAFSGILMIKAFHFQDFSLYQLEWESQPLSFQYALFVSQDKSLLWCSLWSEKIVSLSLSCMKQGMSKLGSVGSDDWSLLKIVQNHSDFILVSQRAPPPPHAPHSLSRV